MIKTIYLENFQSHKNTKIEFSEGVNVITGTSDSGKTSLLRALIWVTENKPGGEAFRSDWGGETSVTIALTNGITISRVKGTHNKYELNDQEFFAFGTKVPEEIQKALNFNDLNIQEQLEKPFLLDETPGKVAAHFNKVANLSRIDTSQANLKSSALKIKQSLATKKETKKKLKANLKTFDSLEKREIELEVLEESEKTLLNQIKSFTKLTKLVEDIKKVNQKLKEKAKITCFEIPLNEIENKVTQLHKAKKNQEAFAAILDKIKSNGIKAEKLKKLTGLDKRVSEILELFKSQAVSIGKNQLLKAITVDISINKEKLLNKRKTLNKLESRFKENFPEICPLCETVIN